MTQMWNLPFEFDPDAYQNWHPDLSTLDEHELIAHYNAIGKQHGLPCNRLGNRGDFAALVPPDADALEIGPFAGPLLFGPRVKYCDVLDTAQLKRRAPEHGMDPARVPDIDFVMANASLDDIDARFDAILSSHAIEHQPDFIAHLRQIERRLNPAGRYFVLVPDKRFCFDRNIAPSTIADFVEAHAARRTVHTLKSVIEHRAFMVHNDPGLHWNAPLAETYDGRNVDPGKVEQAIAEYQAAAGAYIDVHAWYFTPDSFRNILSLLFELKLTRLKVERLYRTRRNSVEFWAVLCEEPGAQGPHDAAANGPEVPRGEVNEVPELPLKRRGGLLGQAFRSMLRNQ